MASYLHLQSEKILQIVTITLRQPDTGHQKVMCWRHLTGDPAGKSLAEQDAKKEVGGDAAEAVPLEEEMAADCQAASTQTAKSNSSAERPDGDDDSDVVVLSPTSCLETSESSQKKAHEMNLATGSEEVQVPTQKQSKVQTIVAKSF